MMIFRRLQALVLGLILLLLLMPSVASALKVPHNFGASIPSQAFDNVTQCTKSHFFGLEPWYQYIGGELDTSSGSCEVKCFNILDQGVIPEGQPNAGKPNKNECGQVKSDVPMVILAVIDDLLRIAALVAIGFVLYGAFRYTASQGNPEQTAQAQSTIINALIGLAIATVAIAFVSFLGSKLGSIGP